MTLLQFFARILPFEMVALRTPILGVTLQPQGLRQGVWPR